MSATEYRPARYRNVTTGTAERMRVASVDRRFGAWIIVFDITPLTEDLGHLELVDCAGSLAVAKRVAREAAAAFGYTGAARWTKLPDGDWELEMTHAEEYTRDEDY